jgi:ketosteroid isomerase-like protein
MKPMVSLFAMTSRFATFQSVSPGITPNTVDRFGRSSIHFVKVMILGVALLLATSLSAAAQDATDPASAARRSRVMALESAWGMAEKNKDAKALDALLDDSLTYTDYDGTLKTKSDFLAGVKAPGHSPEQEVVESTSAQVYGDTAVVIGVYRVKGIDKGKPYLRRGRFTDTWVNRYGSWVCVASQYTLISR